MKWMAICASALAALAALPATAAATHCPPVPTTVSFEKAYGETVTPQCDETASPYTFDDVTPGTSGTFTRVRPTLQSPPVRGAPYGGRWAARLTRSNRTDSVYAEKNVDWTPEVSGSPLFTADVYYQGRFYLRSGFIAALPNEGVYLVRWENDVHGGQQECGGVTLTRAGNPVEARLRVVRQTNCNSPSPSALQTVIQSGVLVKESEWTSIWVNQKLSGDPNSCTAFALPFCAGAYTAATLGNDSVRISRNVNYDGGSEHVKRVRYGLMPTTAGVSGSSLDLLLDCLGQADPCGQELPVRAALYDPLAADRWGSPAGAESEYLPSLGYYAFDSTTVQGHIAAMQYAGVQAGISRWEGTGTVTDDRFTTLLTEAAAHSGGFKWAINYAPEENGNPTAAQIRADITSLNSTRPGLTTAVLEHPSYLRVGGKPVIFVSADADELGNLSDAGCNMVQRWSDSHALQDYYVVMRAFPGHLTTGTCPSTPRKPSSWHDYALDAPAMQSGNKPNTSTPYSYWISPGYEDKAEPGARLARDFLRWTENVQDMVASKADWQLMPFNQWHEGAATESAAEWGSPSGRGFYLDTLHSDGVPTNKIIAAAGDIACESGPVPPPGPGAVERCHYQQVSDIFIKALPGGGSVPRAGLTSVLTMGDNQYDCGQLSEFQSQFDPTWGRAFDLLKPTPGNHEYKEVEGVPDCGGQQANGYFQYFGAVAGQQPFGWYGFSLGPDWEFIALNSDCRPLAQAADAPCTTEDRDAWLAGYLASLGSDVDKKCVAGFWHHPRFSSGRTLAGVFGPDNWQRDAWEMLYESPVNADLILNGHGHFYERFGPLTPLGQADQSNGIRSITIGTGGVAVPRFETLMTSGGAFESRAVTRKDQTYGVGQFVLYDRPNPSDPASRGSYNFQFTPEPTMYGPGTSSLTVYQDAYSATCH